MAEGTIFFCLYCSEVNAIVCSRIEKDRFTLYFSKLQLSYALETLVYIEKLSKILLVLSPNLEVVGDSEPRFMIYILFFVIKRN